MSGHVTLVLVTMVMLPDLSLQETTQGKTGGDIMNDSGGVGL